MQWQQFVPFLFLMAHVVVNNIKVFRVAIEIQQWVLQHCRRATKHFVLLLTTIGIKSICVCACILSLASRHAHHIFRRQIILPFVAWHYHISTLSHKRHIFLGKKILKIKRVLIISYNFCLTFLILRRTQQDINPHTSSCKVPVIIVRLTCNFHDTFSKTPGIL
jgi:hypothetical protein